MLCSLWPVGMLPKSSFTLQLASYMLICCIMHSFHTLPVVHGDCLLDLIVELFSFSACFLMLCQFSGESIDSLFFGYMLEWTK